MDTYLSILSKINDPETSLVVQGKKIKNQLETIFTEYIFVFRSTTTCFKLVNKEVSKSLLSLCLKNCVYVH